MARWFHPVTRGSYQDLWRQRQCLVPVKRPVIVCAPVLTAADQGSSIYCHHGSLCGPSHKWPDVSLRPILSPRLHSPLDVDDFRGLIGSNICKQTGEVRDLPRFQLQSFPGQTAKEIVDKQLKRDPPLRPCLVICLPLFTCLPACLCFSARHVINIGCSACTRRTSCSYCNWKCLP